MTKSTCIKVGLIVSQSLPFPPARQLLNERHFVRKNVGELVAREPVLSNTRLVRDLGTAKHCCKRFQFEKVV